jgi:hypothetical protein
MKTVVVHLLLDGNGIPHGSINIDLEDRADNLCSDPRDNTKMMKRSDWILLLAADPAARQQGGWDELTNIPGMPEGATLFDVIVAEGRKKSAHAEVQAVTAAFVAVKP